MGRALGIPVIGIGAHGNLMVMVRTSALLVKLASKPSVYSLTVKGVKPHMDYFIAS